MMDLQSPTEGATLLPSRIFLTLLDTYSDYLCLEFIEGQQMIHLIRLHNA
jgi:hypothetical protein